MNRNLILHTIFSSPHDCELLMTAMYLADCYLSAITSDNRILWNYRIPCVSTSDVVSSNNAFNDTISNNVFSEVNGITSKVSTSNNTISQVNDITSTSNIIQCSNIFSEINDITSKISTFNISNSIPYDMSVSESQVTKACINISMKYHCDNELISRVGYKIEIDILKTCNYNIPRNVFYYMYSICKMLPSSFKILCQHLCDKKMYNITLPILMLSLRLLYNKKKLSFLNEYRREVRETMKLYITILLQ